MSLDFPFLISSALEDVLSNLRYINVSILFCPYVHVNESKKTTCQLRVIFSHKLGVVCGSGILNGDEGLH